MLEAVSGNALQAALEAAEQMQQTRCDLRTAIQLKLEQTGYEAGSAARRYDSIDPDQRLVAAELEARWNVALQKVKGLECKFRSPDIPLLENQRKMGSRKLQPPKIVQGRSCSYGLSSVLPR